MKINVDRSFLEINSISDLNRSKSPGSNFKITEVDPPDFHLNKFFYKQIGRKHRWIDRLTWADKKWIEYVENPRNYFSKNYVSPFKVIQERIIGHGYGFFGIYRNGVLKSFFMHNL